MDTDEGAVYDKVVVIDGASLAPHVSWGTNPGMVAPVTGRVPDPNSFDDEAEQRSAVRALEYMDLEPDTPIENISLDRVFIGSCTNSRIEDLRTAAEIAKGRRVSDSVYAMVVPGSAAIKKQAEDEGSGRHLHGRRVRLARRGLLHVPGHESRHPPARRALRLDLQPQLRGPAGQGRAYAPGQPGDGRRRRHRGPLRRRPGVVESP